ncbi:NAD(P)H-dependent oxidoreductase [Falsiroseomonas sp. HW251]|uniref:NAD(P)H-dependent oxidoreductase n=1 Tax=Falsiroseomonas sp. HW251 TaxID=3390998 RepID=UPI003D31231E
MHALIVHAHPEPTSFNAAMTAAAVAAIRAAGHDVEVSNLCAEGFGAVAGRGDMTTVADPARFHLQAEQDLAARNGAFAADVAREQDRLRRADLLVLQFPIWWGAPPAILKGWFDRVLAYGFAYVDGRRFDTGLLKGRRALMGVTTGGTTERFSDAGAYGEIGRVLWPVRRLTLEYMGLAVEEPFVAYAAPRVDAGTRDGYLAAWGARVGAALDAQAAAGPSVAGPDSLRPVETARGWASGG